MARTQWLHRPAAGSRYFAVIFVSERSDDQAGYAEMDERLLALAHEQPGFLGYSSAGDEQGGIFISYWASREAIDSWRKHALHQEAKGQATRWYRYYHSLITEVVHHREHEEDS